MTERPPSGTSGSTGTPGAPGGHGPATGHPAADQGPAFGPEPLARPTADGPADQRAATDAAVTCQLTPADLQALHNALYRPAWGARHWGRHEGLRRVLAAVSLATLVALLVKLFARNKLGADLVGWDTVAGVALAGAGGGLWWARQNTTVPPTDSLLYRPVTFSLETAGLRMRGEGFDNLTLWNQVSGLREAGGCVLIDTRLGTCHAVPRSAFASPEAADAFIARARALQAGGP